jgi:hypothetical protein
MKSELLSKLRFQTISKRFVLFSDFLLTSNDSNHSEEHTIDELNIIDDSSHLKTK